MDLELRDYQSAAIDGLRDAYRAGHKRPILCAPTGSGKTEMAMSLMRDSHRLGKRVAFVADRRTLVSQTSQRLASIGLPHGVIMAGDTFGRGQPIQVCSAQTLEKRDTMPGLDLLIIDECHAVRKATRAFMDGWGGRVLGLSATPLTGRLGEVYDSVVNAVTTEQLLADGWLAPLRIYAATEIDMSGAKKAGGEWQASEVRDRGRHIIGDVVSTWERMTAEHFGGPVKTLLFSADTRHGEELCRSFQAAGHDFRQSTYRDTGADTEQIVSDFRAGRFTGLVSVEKFVKGFDVPDVLCLVGCRPYSGSLAAVIQQMGRGMRIAPGKDYCLYLDHAGNCAGWYDQVAEVWAEGVAELDTGSQKSPSRREGKERPDVVCSKCQFVRPPGARECPSCGYVWPRRSNVVTVPGELVEYGSGRVDYDASRRGIWEQLSAITLHRRRDGDYAQAKRRALAVYRARYGEWPDRAWGYNPQAVENPDPRIVAMLDRDTKKWRDSR